MDFERVLRTLLSEFDRGRIRYATIGGFALGVWGAPRGTMDLDFLIHQDDLEHLHQAMVTLGYQRPAKTENVSHYVHPDATWGRVDFIHAFRPHSLQLLEHAKVRRIFHETQEIRVVDPEGVIGFKVQAMANNPKRRTQDLADIETLLDLYGSTLDWTRIQGYFDLFELSQEGRQLQERFRHVQ
jgi:hypothetical protein